MHVTDRVRAENGSVLVLFAVWLPVMIACAVLAVDVANWFVHRRHLQHQADAAALAAARDFQFPCSAATETAVTNRAMEYSGAGATTTLNKQVGDANRADSSVFALVNQPNFFNQPATDNTVGGICDTKMIDVKMTETDLPWFFDALGVVPFINAHARVSIEQADSTFDTIPFALANSEPKAARAFFVNESDSNSSMAQPAVLEKCPGTVGGLFKYSNDGCGNPANATPRRVTVGSNAEDVGVRLGLSENTGAFNCGDEGAACYDDPKGALHIRGWTGAGSAGGGQKLPPIVRGVRLTPGALCSDAYFLADPQTCGSSPYTANLIADIEFDNTLNNPNAQVTVTATVEGSSTPHPLTYNSGTDLWSSVIPLPLPRREGGVEIDLKWSQRAGEMQKPGGGGGGNNGNGQGGGNNNNQTDNCTTNSPCVRDFEEVARPYTASEANAGTIRFAKVTAATAAGVPEPDGNSLERCSSVKNTCDYDMTVTILVAGLENSSDFNEAPRRLRTDDSQNTGLVDCVGSPYKDQIEKGCGRTYRRKDPAETCPDVNQISQLQSDPNYRAPCVLIETGNKQPINNELNLRIHEGTTCTNPNRWDDARIRSLTDGQASAMQWLLSDPNDERIVHVFVVPFGTFTNQPSGQRTIPIIDFATFYLTGWEGDPCTDSDSVGDSEEIVGHFVKFVEPTSGGSGSGTPCDPNAFGACVAVLTE